MSMSKDEIRILSQGLEKLSEALAGRSQSVNINDEIRMTLDPQQQVRDQETILSAFNYGEGQFDDEQVKAGQRQFYRQYLTHPKIAEAMQRRGVSPESLLREMIEHPKKFDEILSKTSDKLVAKLAGQHQDLTEAQQAKRRADLERTAKLAGTDDRRIDAMLDRLIPPGDKFFK